MAPGTNWGSAVEAAFRLDSVKRVAVFGAGKYGQVALELAARCGWNVAYLVDNNQRLWNTMSGETPVQRPETLLQERVDLILIASNAHAEAIGRQLDGMGFVFGRDYISFLTPIQLGSVRLRVTV